MRTGFVSAVNHRVCPRATDWSLRLSHKIYA